MFYWNHFLLEIFLFIYAYQPIYADGNSFPLSADDQATIQNDIKFLTNGVSALKLPNQPANLEVFGKFAYILAKTSTADPVNVWAAGRLGSGKVCAFTSNKYCKMDNSTQPLDNGKAMQNCINWVSKNTNGSLPATSIVGIVTQKMSYNKGFTKSSKTTFQIAQDLNGIHFVVVHEDWLWFMTESQLNVLENYVKRGGGLIACNAPWDKTASSMPTNPGNTLLLEAGIRWTIDSDSKEASVTVNKVPLSEWWKTNPWYTANVLAKGITSTISDEATIQRDIKFLTNGITAIKLESKPANLIAFGKYSYILANTPRTSSVGNTFGVTGVNVWGAARMGSGKVCAFSSSKFCWMTSSPPLDNGKIMQNCINWVSNNTAGALPASSIIGMIPPEMTFTQGFTISPKKTFQTAADLNDIKFVVLHQNTSEHLKQSQLDVLARYVKGGGGLIVCNAPWDDKQEKMPTNPGNVLLAEAGLRWTIDSDNQNAPVMLKKYQPNEWWKTNEYYESNLIAQVINTPPIPNITAVMSKYNSLLSFVTYYKESPSLTKCIQVVGASKIIELVCNMNFTFPISSSFVPMEFKCVDFIHTFRYFLPLNENHPIAKAASIIPGYPSANRKTQTVQVTFSLTHRKWLSSGYFVWPGSYLNVTVPISLVNKGFEIQVGAQNDQLWGRKSIYYRWPHITHIVPIKEASFSFFSFGGGPLYLYVPSNWRTYGIKDVTITLTGQIVKHPWFKLGRDSESDWNSMLASNTAPLGEVESDYFIITVNATWLKTVKNITELALWHKSFMWNYYDLRGNPIGDYKERLVVDVQISAGFGHSGYPVMANDGNQDFPWTKSVLWPTSNVKITNQYETKANYWGLFHEIGHNWQLSAWTAPDHGEVTNNIFTLYNKEMYSDGPYQFGYNDELAVTIKTPSDLYIFINLRQAFGWEAFRQFFRLFETNAELGASGKDQAIDNWLRYFSQTVKRDIRSLLDEKKKSYSESAKKAASQYRAWDVKAIIDCQTAAFPTAPCMTVSGKTNTSYSFSLVLWARINFTEALEIRFVGTKVNDAVTGIVENKTNKVWEKHTYNSSTHTLRLQPYKRLNHEDKISFSITTTSGFQFTKVWVKIVEVATSKIMHIFERSLEKV